MWVKFCNECEEFTDRPSHPSYQAASLYGKIYSRWYVQAKTHVKLYTASY